MISSSKSTILTYAIILLLLVNIAVIGLVIFQKCSHHKPMDCCPPPGKEMEKNKCMADLLENDMKFSKEQMKQFHDLKSDFHPTAKLYFDSLEKLESDFFGELVKPQTDTVKLYSFANEFGRLQNGLKHQTIEHLIKIKSICTPEQQKKYFNHITKNRHCNAGLGIVPSKKHDCPEMKK